MRRAKGHLSSLLLILFLSIPGALLTAGGYSGNPFIDVIITLMEDCGLPITPTGFTCLFGDEPEPLSNPTSLSSPRLEANLGQTDLRYPYIGRGTGYYLFLNHQEMVFDLRKTTGEPQNLIRLRLGGRGTAAQASGFEPLNHRINYFIGADSSRWITNVPTFAKAGIRNAYPGIDMVFYGHDSGFEQDFVVAPGADPRQIRMQFTGAESLSLDNSGNLILSAGTVRLLWKKPITYQTRFGRRTEIQTTYDLRGNEVTFRIAAGYDRSLPLVIDPVISYLSYVGRSESSLAGRSTVDAQGSVYLTGSAQAGTWPTTPGAATPSTRGFSPGNIFLTKMNPAGGDLVYSTYIGGVGAQIGAAVAVDAQGNAYITGVTNATDFPTTPGSLRPTVPPFTPGSPDLANCFVMKLNPAGSAVLYSTYLGGRSRDGCTSIAIDAQGNAYVTGGTESTDFPTTDGAFQSNYRLGTETFKYDAFVSKLNPTGSALTYSTYFGGGGNELASSIAVDAQGNAYIAGVTSSAANFPVTQGAADTTFGGSGGSNDLALRLGDAFAAKFNATGTALVYSTYIGGARDDMAFSIAVDPQGAAYVAGNTLSTDFPTTAGALSRTFSGLGGEPLLNAGDAFVTKVAPDGRSFAYSTYLGGSQDDRALQIAVDRNGSAYVAGNTLSANFPITPDATQNTNRNRPNTSDRVKFGNGFIAQLDPAGSRLAYGTYLGGTNNDWINGISLGPDNSIYVSGTTSSSDLTTTSGAYQQRYFGGIDPQRPLGDVFVAKFGDAALPAIAGVSNAASYASGASPGMIAVMAGVNIGPDTLTTARLDANGRVATSLADTTITVNNIPAPLVYVSKSQSSFIVPYDVSAGTSAQVVVTYRGVRSAPWNLPINAANPGLFSANSSGTGQGAILNENNSFNSAQNPAEKGSIVVLFLTGEGQTDPPGSDGQIASNVFPKPALPVRVDFAGNAGEVLYAGAAPGQVAGLMQINVRVPPNSNSGPIPVQVFIGDTPSQRGLTLAVR